MLTQAQVKRQVRQSLKKYKKLLKLEEWHINLLFTNEGMGEDIGATMSTNAHYHNATLRFDADVREGCSLRDVAILVRHELLHLYHWRFNLYRVAVGQHVPESTMRDAADVLDVVYDHSCEDTVFQLEKLLDSLNL